jgi:hypothetical protein
MVTTTDPSNQNPIGASRLRHLRDRTDAERALFVIEQENVPSLRVARSLGAHLVEPKARLSGRTNLWYAVELASEQ